MVSPETSVLCVLRYTILPNQVPNLTEIRTTLLVVPGSGSDDHKIPVASPASLHSPLTLLFLSQYLCLGRHPWRNNKSPLVLCSSPLSSLLPHHVALQALCHDQHILTSVCYCHPAAIPHHLPKQGALWSSSWHCCQHVSGMDPPDISPDLSMVKLCTHQPIFMEP